MADSKNDDLTQDPLIQWFEKTKEYLQKIPFQTILFRKNALFCCVQGNFQSAPIVTTH